ncbi:MAG: TrkH family potassium uptake protein, partial [Thermoplasmata archaeon]|nr:TrkH family potassium uptake protein [Thermoplasmata archaeon]
MRFKAISDAVGTVMVFFSLTLIIPLLVGIIYHEPLIELLKTFILPAILSVLLGGVMKLYGEGRSRDIRYREALATVSLSWLLMSFVGALPYLLSGMMSSFTNAYFESMSGFTATGATVIEDLTAYPLSLLFWRSFTQWIGGMGVVVLSVAILTALLGGGR